MLIDARSGLRGISSCSLSVAFLSLSLAVTISTASFAQGVQSGALRGVATDQQDRPISGVKVTATSMALQGPRSTITDAAGDYVLAALPPGDYRLNFELTGFTTAIVEASVPLGLTVVKNVSLQVGRLNEHVEVVATAPSAKAEPAIGANFKQSEIEAKIEEVFS